MIDKLLTDNNIRNEGAKKLSKLLMVNTTVNSLDLEYEYQRINGMYIYDEKKKRIKMNKQ